ncbi:patatin-like phospholipase family protein [Litorivivens sp.]|uniref:patatin-like phospholipase family protein n=1 Tax=Litorivivens sp. TaxID=2020868 RepID=UPI003564A6E3
MSSPLRFRAGPKARRFIEQNGLHLQDIAALAGAAGGPKWLVLAGIDRMLADWLGERKAPLPMVGASIGSWRFAALAQSNPKAAIDRLENLYIEQAYVGKPSYRQVTQTATRLVSDLLGATGVSDILEHPWARLHIVTALCRGWTGKDAVVPMGIGFGAAMALNTLRRPLLGAFLERHVFADPREGVLSLAAFPGFSTQLPELTAANLPSALLASGSIPFVMEAVKVQGQSGNYRDGGMVDYHMDLPLSNSGIVLMPHFSKLLIPGWLDKFVPWRKPRFLENTLVIHPSDEWIATLPNRKIPDRNDFEGYRNDDAGRFRDWRLVAQRSEELADFLAQRIQRQDIASMIEPL